jgi:type VI secretion system secreted protein VgrG
VLDFNGFNIAFASHPVGILDVRHVSIHEAASQLFHITVDAVASDDSIDLNSIVGKGAALKARSTSGARVWAGICSNMTQLHTEPPPGVTTYRVEIVPTFWRTTLRKNSRIFQHMTTPAIVQKVLSEWQITPEMKLQAQYRTHEYCVQYGETDFAFICRLLEDAGITFYFSYEALSGKGDDITKLVLNDSPQLNPQWGGTLDYVGSRAAKPMSAAGDWCSDVALTQQVKTGTFRRRDFDFRGRPDALLVANTASGTNEDPYEQYAYTPGAFWWEPGQGGGTPVADDKGTARTDMGEANELITRIMDAERRARLSISLQTNAIDLCPGVIIGINQNALGAPHPRADLAPDKKILLVESTLDGDATGEWTLKATGVFAEFTYRPIRKTPRPLIYGVQSAVVVGPAGQEIYTDEFGRVRVQFPWDREGKYDDNSSCWMRVSQAWAGGSFGIVMLPRIGHEVLVEFFEGDPDRPVIVGRVYNATTTTPYALPENMTQSGWKSNSSPGGGGYNEIKFEDLAGQEFIGVQAQKDLNYVVNNNVTGNIGNSRTVAIGTAETLNIGQTRMTSIGMQETHSVGMQRTLNVGMMDMTNVGLIHTISVGPTVGTSMMAANQTIIISTGSSSIKLAGPDVFVNAQGEIHIHAGKDIDLTSAGGTITIQGAPKVDINPKGAGGAPVIDKVNPAMPPIPPSPPTPGLPGTPPFIPSGGGSIPKPGGIEDVDFEDPSETP